MPRRSLEPRSLGQGGHQPAATRLDGPTKDALAAGAKGFVNKPYDIRQVLEVVRSVLDDKMEPEEGIG